MLQTKKKRVNYKMEIQYLNKETFLNCYETLNNVNEKLFYYLKNFNIENNNSTLKFVNIEEDYKENFKRIEAFKENFYTNKLVSCKLYYYGLPYAKVKYSKNQQPDINYSNDKTVYREFRNKIKSIITNKIFINEKFDSYEGINDFKIYPFIKKLYIENEQNLIIDTFLFKNKEDLLLFK